MVLLVISLYTDLAEQAMHLDSALELRVIGDTSVQQDAMIIVTVLKIAHIIMVKFIISIIINSIVM